MKALLLLALVSVASASVFAGQAPSLTVCPDAPRAELLARQYAKQHGGRVLQTSGTPSMRPLIQGKAFVVVTQEPYGAITRNSVLVYRGRSDSRKPDRSLILHRAILHDRYGWLMSGDNNRWSESWDRVTTETYVGTVTAIFDPRNP